MAATRFFEVFQLGDLSVIFKDSSLVSKGANFIPIFLPISTDQNIMKEVYFKYSVSFILISSLIFFSPSFASATDTLSVTQRVHAGDTLVSSNGTFQLGFFSPGHSGNWYLGIWYGNQDGRTVVWVANRDVPIANTTGVVLNVIRPGILALLNHTNGVIWSSSTSTSLQNPVAQLLDSGNLVVREANDDRPDNFTWQSFDHPADTVLPGMKFGWNLVTGVETYFSSWRGVDDPAQGDVSFHLDPTGFPQLLMKRGDVVLMRIGPWNGQQLSGDPVRQSSMFRVTFVMNENEVSYRRVSIPPRTLRFTVNQSGIGQRWAWEDQRGWIAMQILPADICDGYSFCGANGICTIGNARPCDCLDRFVQRDPNELVTSDWTNGCIRRRNLSCESDAFLRYSGIKLPDARNSTYNTTMTLNDCRRECLMDCSCTAYTQLDIERRTGCLFWHGELYDIRSISVNAQDIYIRMASSESEIEGKNRQILLASLTSIIGVALIGLSLFIYMIRKKNCLKAKKGLYDEIDHKDLVLPSFDLSVILAATDNFRYKIGEGGFGPVYKGMLEGGQEIAVKRLSKSSKQGLTEFKNEIAFIAKLQHRNLVRLLDQTKRTLLDWPTRFHIINGVARGLMYLHQDSRLRIIHRDLKASNVLLDFDMNPKISDFGMAKCFLGNETEARTRRVVGTYGYMAPEYAVDGLFSMKSDVFSFGVLILETVSGTRNRCFVHNDHSFNLLGHAWILYYEGRLHELVDDCLTDSYDSTEVIRTIHVGLLCVQNKQDDRPTMSNVVHMLENQGILPQAKQPGFFTERDVLAAQNLTSSSNDMTFTMPEARW